MIEALITNLNNDIAILQNRVALGNKVGFTAMARLLEAISIQLFRAVDIANLTNKNLFQVNFPAIDAADDDRRIAVQVTSVASPAKIRTTIESFKKTDPSGRSLKDDYTTLYIFGFCKASTLKNLPEYCLVIDPGYFVQRLIDLNNEEILQQVVDAIRSHADYSSLHPHDDLSCLKIVMGYLSRNAVTHPMLHEGSLSSMIKGLDEISELIGKGTVNRRSKSKAHHEFEDLEIAEFLVGVLKDIGAIKAIINRRANEHGGGMVNLNQQDMIAIDNRKRAISDAARAIAASRHIHINVDMHDVA